MSHGYIIRGDVLEGALMRRYLETVLERAKIVLLSGTRSEASSLKTAVMADCLTASEGLAERMPELADALHDLATHLETGSQDLIAADVVAITRQMIRL